MGPSSRVRSRERKRIHPTKPPASREKRTTRNKRHTKSSKIDSNSSRAPFLFSASSTPLADRVPWRTPRSLRYDPPEWWPCTSLQCFHERHRPIKLNNKFNSLQFKQQHTLLGAPGIATRSRTLLGASGLMTSSKPSATALGVSKHDSLRRAPHIAPLWHEKGLQTIQYK